MMEQQQTNREGGVDGAPVPGVTPSWSFIAMFTPTTGTIVQVALLVLNLFLFLRFLVLGGNGQRNPEQEENKGAEVSIFYP